jgi:hypothetical protein
MERKTVFLVLIHDWEDGANKWGGIFSTKELAEKRKEFLNQSFLGNYKVREIWIDYYTNDNLIMGPDTL